MTRARAILVAVAALVGAACATLGAACGGDDTSGTTPRTDGGADATTSDGTGGDTGATPTDGASDASAGLATGQIDRMGRPLVSTALVYADPDGGPLNHKGAYNKASSWGSAPPFVPQDFDDHLKALDAVVSGNQWTPDGGTHPLVAPLSQDVLVVDPNMECGDKGSFLDVELHVLGFYALPDGGAASHTTCGGRTPNDDVLDHELSLMAAKFAGWTPALGSQPDPVKDCVGGATKPARATWPYLADPN